MLRQTLVDVFSESNVSFLVVFETAEEVDVVHNVFALLRAAAESSLVLRSAFFARKRACPSKRKAGGRRAKKGSGGWI